MKSIYYILNRCLHYLLALQILNLSFSNLAMQESSSSAENNQIDSVLEYVTEHVLGWNDFIPEQHKAHQDKHFMKGTVQPLFCERISSPVHIVGNNNLDKGFYFISGILSEYYLEINPPPPKETDFI
jgi:hypothetical protein